MLGCSGSRALDRGLRRPVRRLRRRGAIVRPRRSPARRDGLPVHPDRRARAATLVDPGENAARFASQRPAGADAGRGRSSCSTRWSRASTRRSACTCAAATTRASGERGRLRRDLRGRLQGRPRLRRLPPRVRRPPLGRLRRAARVPDDKTVVLGLVTTKHEDRDGREAPRPHRRGRAALPPRAAVAVHAVRVRVGPGGQPDRVRDPGAQAGAGRRGGAEGLASTDPRLRAIPVTQLTPRGDRIMGPDPLPDRRATPDGAGDHRHRT